MKKFVSINSKYYTSNKYKGLNVHNSRKKFNRNGNLLIHKNTVPEVQRQGKVFENVSKKFNDFNELLEKQKEIQYKKKSYHKKNSNTYYEQVLVLSEDMFLEEMKKGNKDLILKSIEDYMNLIKKEYGFEPLEFHLHLDEGHTNPETEEFHLNVHAHIGFINFDFDKEKTVLRGINKAGFSKMQDLAQKAFQDNGLDFVRGVSKDLSKKKHKDKEAFVRNKIDKVYKNLRFAESLLLKIDNLDKISLEQIQEKKVQYKDNKLIKRILDTFYKIKNKQIQEKDFSKDIERLEKTISKLSSEEKELLDSITVKTEKFRDLEKFEEWSENPDKFVEKIKAVELAKKNTELEKTIDELKKLVIDTTKSAERKIEEVENSKQQAVNEERWKWENRLKSEENKTNKLRRDVKNLVVQNNKHILVHSVWQQFADQLNVKEKFIAAEQKLMPQIDKRLEEVSINDYDPMSNKSILDKFKFDDLD